MKQEKSRKKQRRRKEGGGEAGGRLGHEQRKGRSCQS
jgi:hypothetical protein